MVKAVTLSSIHVCETPAVVADDGKVTKRAVIKSIQSKMLVELEQKDFDDFEAAGAVRAPTRGELASVGLNEAVENDPTVDAPVKGKPGRPAKKAST